MNISSSLCKAQEQAQRERAASATLDNVRDAAERAATAWEKEGVEASGREQRALARVNRQKFSEAMLRSAREGAALHEAGADRKPTHDLS